MQNASWFWLFIFSAQRLAQLPPIHLRQLSERVERKVSKLILAESALFLFSSLATHLEFLY